MKITLFGAAFDPPHVGHQAIAVSLLSHHLTDAVWLLPVKEHPFGKKLSAESDRLAMVELLAQAVREELLELRVYDSAQAVRVERFELDQAGTSYTYRTLQTLAAEYPQHQFSFVIGSDNLARFHEWPEYATMPTQFPFYIYPREGYPLQPLYPGMIVMKNVQPVTVSSTLVREKVGSGESIVELVPEPIAAYIQKHQLYQKK